MVKEKVKCGKCGKDFWKEDYENKSCPYCGHVAKGNKKDRGMCFITTACVKTAGLSDNCHELKMMREFRDNYLDKSVEGKDLINEYYKIAPYIVNAVSKNKNSKEIFYRIFNEIREIVYFVEIGELEKAKIKYCQMVRKLAKNYNLEKKRKEVEN